MKRRRHSGFLAVAVFSAAGLSGRIALADGGGRISLAGTVHPLARPEFDRGPADPDLPMERIVLALKRRSGAPAALERFLANQQDPFSPDFHRWLTPEEFGRRFGLTDADLAKVIEWLSSQGFRIDEVARGRGWIDFSGTAAQVERAFQTDIHEFAVGQRRVSANSIEPSVPEEIAPLVAGIASLSGFYAAPGGRAGSPPVSVPEFNRTGGFHAIAPADFAVIYNVSPLYEAGFDGSGQSVAIVGRSDVHLSDLQSFRSTFGLASNDPDIIYNGPNPGFSSSDDEGESVLDVEWSGAVARGAKIKLVVSKSTSSSDGILLSAQYIVDNNIATVLSNSYQNCEADSGFYVQVYSSLWQQAAAQGISVFVISGDDGAAGCDDNTATHATRGRAVNGLASGPYDTVVGGTQFNDRANPSAYWASQQDPATGESALSYIPEVAWNESGGTNPDDPGEVGLWTSGGGASLFFPKPSWQSAPGVPADGARDLPDVSLTAADHDAYLVFLDGGRYLYYGTSAAGPSFAGLIAVINQKTGGAQGNVNPTLYRLGNNQYALGGPAVFHDVIAGGNSVPGVAGFSCGPGYDQVTGLGSVDANALAAGWTLAPPGPCVPDDSTLCIDGQPGDRRFRIEVFYETSQGGGVFGPGHAVALTSLGVARGGLFWFFSADNPEMLVKILDGCAVDGETWAFYSAGTNVGLTVTVTDTKTGAQRIYTNPDGTAASPLQDTSAFADCP